MNLNAGAPEQNRLQAVALAYNPDEDHAPRVIASGQGLLAKQIIALARANGIPIRNDPLLAAALATVDLEATIPPELYRLVAEVMAYVFRIRQRQTAVKP
jgi:flagellar biosynthesis protein